MQLSSSFGVRFESTWTRTLKFADEAKDLAFRLLLDRDRSMPISARLDLAAGSVPSVTVAGVSGEGVASSAPSESFPAAAYCLASQSSGCGPGLLGSGMLIARASLGRAAHH